MPVVHDVLIVGGGLVGACLALALQRSGLSVALIDAQPPQPVSTGADWDIRVYAISPGNAAFLDALGVWQRLDPQRVQRVESMMISGDRPEGRLSFSAYDAGLRELAHIVESSALQRALYQAMAEADPAHPAVAKRAINLEVAEDCARVELADGNLLQARLVVGADGGNSWLRQAAGLEARITDYQQVGLVANFETAQHHRGAAFQWFRDDGVLALLPLPGRRVSMVWSTTADHAQTLLALAAEALAAQVEAASSSVLGSLQLITLPAGFPLRLAHVPKLVAPRVALAGDAAHNVHPLAGQGVNLGFRDVRELVKVLAARVPGQDCGDRQLLRRYERARREDIVTMGLGTDGLQKLFAARAVWVSGVRNSGMAAVDHLPFLKNLLIRHAAA
ncbi:MAG: UbiH/UbiF family hydroxylase [Burkholderiales bacterium]|nr:UbiH/UbiF family hydroxylase [Burkholderiales bacterium]